MGLYREHVLPRIVDRVMGSAEVTRMRAELGAQVAGDVVEVGFGSGRSLAHYPDAVTGVWAVEPSALSRRLAAPRIAERGLPVTWAGLDGQALDLPDKRFDAAVSSWTLCTIPDAVGALRELRRVLRPDGLLHFVEHGLAPDDDVRRWQRRLEPIQRRLGGGCHLTRRIDELVLAAGFDLAALERTYAAGEPRAFGATYAGRAQPG